MPGFVAAGIEQENPLASLALEDAFDTLTIEPASGGYDAICDIDRCDVRVYLRGETLGETRKRAKEARGCRGDNQLRDRRTAKSFGGGGVAGESWFGKIGTLDAKNAGCAGGGEGIRGGLNVLTDEADFQRRVELLRKSDGRTQCFEGDFGQGAARFVDVGEEKDFLVHDLAIQSAISRATSSAARSLTMRV